MLCNCFYCGVCGGFEGTLTKECPGYKVHDLDLDLVYKATLDYQEGRWINRPRLAWEHPFEPSKNNEVDAAVTRLNWDLASRQLSKLFGEAPNVRKRSA
jgi:hypothetical protein